MNVMPIHKYKAYAPMTLPNRNWPSKIITSAPAWCSVDLRDGNQALVTPMNVDEKLFLFNHLVEIGFKEIEVGFPSASRTEFDFIRLLIEKDLIPEDVTIQVLTQAREQLLTRTFESLRGVKRAIVHLYNSTSTLQRKVVFRMDRAEVLGLAVSAAKQLREEAAKMGESVIFYEYTPESFTGTELDFALEICEAVAGVLKPSPGKKLILNLPATVEMSTPNVYADQIEWFCGHIKNRGSIVVSVHAHNDRGTAVAATELALLAGAERVEGTLFGNGERTGNVDLVTLAMNLFSQGIDPMLDFHDIGRTIEVHEQCTKMPVPARHPYAGELVYTAFSGSHQDAIHKGIKVYREEKPRHWEVPYLPVDPQDVGKTFEAVIRINSQSGKGGVAYVMEHEFGFVLPKEMHPEFGKIVQAMSEETGKEILPEMILGSFEREYLLMDAPIKLISCGIHEQPAQGSNGSFRGTEVTAHLLMNGAERKIFGAGNGPVDAFCRAMNAELSEIFTLASYHEHALEQGSASKAVAYIQIENEEQRRFFGAGIDTNISIASLRAVISALNRSSNVGDRLSAGGTAVCRKND